MKHAVASFSVDLDVASALPNLNVEPPPFYDFLSKMHPSFFEARLTLFPLQDLGSHEADECHARFITCPRRCNENLLRAGDLGLHLKFECTLRGIKCAACGDKVPARELDSHKEAACRYVSSVRLWVIAQALATFNSTAQHIRGDTFLCIPAGAVTSANLIASLLDLIWGSFPQATVTCMS